MSKPKDQLDVLIAEYKRLTAQGSTDALTGRQFREVLKRAGLPYGDDARSQMIGRLIEEGRLRVVFVRGTNAVGYPCTKPAYQFVKPEATK